MIWQTKKKKLKCSFNFKNKIRFSLIVFLIEEFVVFEANLEGTRALYLYAFFLLVC